MQESSLITLKEKSVENNINFLKKKLGKKVKISAVVKANAYGHGIEHIVPLFEKHGIDHYSVFYYQEAVRVSESLSGEAAIMIMGWIADNDMRNTIQKGFEFYIFNVERLKTALEIAQQLGIRAKIHLEAETGMNRTGLNLDEFNEAIRIIKDNPDYIEVVGFCTHLAGAESISNHYRIQKQLKKYFKLLDVLESNEIKPKFKHVANSAAAFVYPASRLDLVRIGIMIYGFWSSTETFIQYLDKKVNKNDPLDRILGWKTQIMATKKIKAGEFVSYGISYLAQNDIVTAVLPIGYAGGYIRSLSNKGQVLLHGQFCRVIGVVNMNMIIIDITHISDAAIGDEVVIIGRQGDLEIKVGAFSDISNKLNYEVLANLPPNIDRKILHI